jgi:hypothetical protein
MKAPTELTALRTAKNAKRKQIKMATKAEPNRLQMSSTKVAIIGMPSGAILTERGVVGISRVSVPPGVLVSRMPCGVALALGTPEEDLAVGFLHCRNTSSRRRHNVIGDLP